MAGDDETGEEPDEESSVAEVEGVQRRLTKAQLRAENIAGFWRRCLADPAGRDALWGVLVDAGTFGVVFSSTPAGFPDGNATFFHLGAKDLGDRIYRTLLLHDRAGVAVMHDEYDPQFTKPKPKRRKDPRNG